MAKYKAIFVDIDNTLLDFDACVKDCFKIGFEEFNLGHYEDWMYDAFNEENRKLWNKIEDGTLTLPELQQIRFTKVFERLGFKGDGPAFERYFRKFIHEYAKEIDDAKEFLDSLKDDYILCAASNGPYEQQLHRLDIAHMKEDFKYFFISEKLGYSKPSVMFFNKAFEELPSDIKPNECIMVGDSESSDIQGGHNAGMHTIFFNKFKKKDLTGITADEKFDSLMEISNFIRSLK